MADLEESSVILKCLVADTGDVMRLRVERPLGVERVQKLIREAIGPALVAEYQDPAGGLHPLTDEALASLTGPIVRLRLYGNPQTAPAIVAARSAGPLAATVSVAKADTAPAPVAKGQRRRQRQQAHRRQRKEIKAQRPEEERGPAEAGCEEGPPAEGEEEDGAGDDEVPIVRAVDICEGMELWVESSITKNLLQVLRDGRVDFDGDLEAPVAFVAEAPARGANETVLALRGPGGRFLRQSEGGALDCCGASAADWECRFSFVDVVEGVVLFLGPTGSGHVCAALGAEAPRVGREAAPQAFRLFAPRPGPEPPGGGSPAGSGLRRVAAAK